MTFSKTGLSIYYKGKKSLRIRDSKRIIKMRKRTMSIGFLDPAAMERTVSTSVTFGEIVATCEKSIGRRLEKNLSQPPSSTGTGFESLTDDR